MILPTAMRLSGLSIGIPLTIMQFALNPMLPVSNLQVLSNFALGHGIYDKDRLDPAHDPPLFNATTAIAAALAAAYYATAGPGTLALAPLVAALHISYADTIKPAMGPAKPFFVSACWTLQTYYVPLLLHAHTAALADITTPASVFLLVAALSHVADIRDMEEDLQDGIHTPAVHMGRNAARKYAVALAVSAMLVFSSGHGASAPNNRAVVEVYNAITDRATDALIDVLNAVLLSSESTHTAAIRLVTSAIKLAETLPPEQARVVVGGALDAMQFGDRAGSLFLHFYESVVRAHFIMHHHHHYHFLR